MQEVLRNKIKEHSKLERIYLTGKSCCDDYLLEKLSILAADICEIIDTLDERGETWECS